MAKVTIVPAILSRGFVRHKTYQAKPTAKRVFDNTATGVPDDTTEAIIIHAVDTNAAGEDVMIGGPDVSSDPNSADYGWRLGPDDSLVAPIDGAGAHEFYEIAADSAPTFQIFELG